MKTNTHQAILNKIKEENIKPKARWYFVAEHAVLWIPGALVTLIGAVAVAGEMYAITHAGWDARDFVYSSQVDFIISMVPFLWLISFGFFGAFIVKALRTTHEGYRLSIKTILLSSVAISIALGIFIYVVDEIFEADSVIRYPVQAREQRVWLSPSEGRLSGIIEKKSENEIQIIDKNNALWSVDTSGLGSTSFPFVKEGKSVRIIGTSTEESDLNDHEFVACAILPWEVGGFVRTPPVSPPSVFIKDSRRQNRMKNKNPDCGIILDDIKKHALKDRNKQMKENK